MTSVSIIVGVLLVLLIAAVVWRFFALRSKGYPVLLRPLPAEDGRNWRHGVLVYAETSAKLYKLRSLRPESDLVLTRLGTDIIDRRELIDRERNIIEDDCHIVIIRHRGKNYELAVDQQGDTALVAWLESAPSARRVRTSRPR